MPDNNATPNGEIAILDRSGAVFSAVRERFLALCELFPDQKEVMRIADQLVGWPIKRQYSPGHPEGRKNTKPGTAMRPSQRIIDQWWGAWLTGDLKAKPEQVEVMRKRVENFLKMEETLTRRGAFAAARKMQTQVMDGSIKQPQLYKYTHDAAGFLVTSLKDETPKQSIQIGKLNINAGPKPAPKVKPPYKRKQLEEVYLNAEFREVPES